MNSKKNHLQLARWQTDVQFDCDSGSLSALGWTFYWEDEPSIRKKTKKYAAILTKIDGLGRVKLTDNVSLRNLMSISGDLFDEIHLGSQISIIVGAPWNPKKFAIAIPNEKKPIFLTNSTKKLIKWLNGKE